MKLSFLPTHYSHVTPQTICLQCCHGCLTLEIDADRKMMCKLLKMFYILCESAYRSDVLRHPVYQEKMRGLY